MLSSRQEVTINAKNLAYRARSLNIVHRVKFNHNLAPITSKYLNWTILLDSFNHNLSSWEGEFNKSTNKSWLNELKFNHNLTWQKANKWDSASIKCYQIWAQWFLWLNLMNLFWLEKVNSSQISLFHYSFNHILLISFQ